MSANEKQQSNLLKIVIRLPGFVDEPTFLAALTDDAARAAVRAAPYYSFVCGKPTSKSLAKRASFCWLGFADRRAATAFAAANSAALQFREPETGKVLGAQFDIALVQRMPAENSGVSAAAGAPFVADEDHDFTTFRAIYNDGQFPMLSTVITNESAATAALDANRASFPVATAAIEASAGGAATPAPQSALVLELVARSRLAKLNKKAPGGKKKNKQKD